MEERRVHIKRNKNNSGSVTGSQTATKSGKWILLVCISFGLLCIVQASLNVYFRLCLETRKLEITEERDKLKLKLQAIDNHASDGWVYFQGSLYLGSTTEQSWQKSRTYCQQRGADLTIISSVQEQRFAHSTFKGRRWIGLSDLEQEGVWKWVDGSLLTTSFWSLGEPNNEKRAEDCGELNYKNELKNWNDDSCGNKKLCICEKKLA